jgi:tetratricopeptide (TPR) repeat protein
VSETNLKHSNIQQSIYNNGLYYNHLLHFKQGKLNDQFPFLQGLMSNDLFPVWQKTDDVNICQTNTKDFTLEEAEVTFASQEAEKLSPVLTESDPAPILTKDDVNEVANSDLEASIYIAEPIHFSNEKIHDEPQNSTTETDDALKIEHSFENSALENNEGNADGIDSDIPLPNGLAFAEHVGSINESPVFTIDEITEGIAEVEARDKKKPKLKHSQKKMLKKNILFFKELPEFNTFNKWLLQQKPMEEGNFIKLLKLSKKAKKLDKKRKLNEGIDASIQKNDKLVSEVLAKILASQGHYPEAIEMYKQLILNIPEKSATFAAQIDELNNKII